MSAITIDGDLVHYEVLGRGRPVILLHGWLGSWRYWIPSMQQLSMKYRTYALDLWGFGDSGKDPRRYTLDAQVLLLREFMEKLGIAKAALVGHDLGAAVVARFALAEPDRVPRLMVIAPPLFRMEPSSRPLTANSASQGGMSLAAASAQVHPEAETIPLRNDEMQQRIREALDKRAQELGEKHLEQASAGGLMLKAMDDVPDMPKMDAAGANAAKANPLRDHFDELNPLALLEKHVPAGADQDKLKVEAGKAGDKALEKTVESFVGVDTLRDLLKLAMPSVMVYGTGDTFLPLPDASMVRQLKDDRPTFNVIAMDGPHHFPMLENIDKFSRLLLDFLETPNVRELTIKEKWERRVR